MASSVSGQEESNPALWLATWVGKWHTRDYPRCPTRKIVLKAILEIFIDQACSVKMAGY